MTDRVQQTIVLLRLRHEWIPGPRARSAESSDDAIRGDIRVPTVCPRCDGEGTLNRRPCPRCQSTGRILASPMTVDEQTAIAAREGVHRTESTKRLDREIRHLERQAKHRLGQLDASEEEKWEAERRILWKTGSFRELDHALRLLERTHPRERQAIELAFGADADIRILSEPLRHLAEYGVKWIAERMPRPIVTPSEEDPAVTEARRRALWRGRAPGHQITRQSRDDTIRLRRAEGWTIAQLCDATGLGRRRIFEILAEQLDHAC